MYTLCMTIGISLILFGILLISALKNICAENKVVPGYGLILIMIISVVLIIMGVSLILTINTGSININVVV